MSEQKTEQQQIEEMEKAAAKYRCRLDCINDCRLDSKGKCIKDEVCKILYAADYRKQSDVAREFVKKLIDFPHWLENGTVLVIHMEELLELAAEFGAEVK